MSTSLVKIKVESGTGGGVVFTSLTVPDMVEKYRYVTPRQGIQCEFLGFSTLTKDDGGDEEHGYDDIDDDNEGMWSESDQLQKNKKKKKTRNEPSKKNDINERKAVRIYGFTSATTKGAVVAHKRAKMNVMEGKKKRGASCVATATTPFNDRKKQKLVIKQEHSHSITRDNHELYYSSASSFSSDDDEDSTHKTPKHDSSALEVSEYVEDIYQHYYQAEDKHRIIDTSYMEKQKHFNASRRALMIDWIVRISYVEVPLRSDTIHLAVNILDRYLSTGTATTVTSSHHTFRQIKLITIVSLVLASKYEEIMELPISDGLLLLNDTTSHPKRKKSHQKHHDYTLNEFVEMEWRVLSTLQCQLTVPTAYHFLMRYVRDANYFSLCVDRFAFADACGYYAERALQEYDFLQYKPSLVAAAAVCLAVVVEKTMEKKKRLRRTTCLRRFNNLSSLLTPSAMDEAVVKHVGLPAKEVSEVASLIARKVQDGVPVVMNRELSAIRDFYASIGFVSDLEPCE